MIWYWISFVIFSIVHLVACFFGYDPLRKITKVFILPFLMLGLLITQTYNLWIFIGLIFGWIGDILLIYTHKQQFFVSGALSFAAGHMAYIIATSKLFLANNKPSDIPIYLYIIFAVVAITLLSVAGFIVKKHIGPVAFLGASYFIILFAAFLMSVFSGLYILSTAFIVFILSDTILCVCKFEKKIKNESFYVMSTYILAQSLICIQFINM